MANVEKKGKMPRDTNQNAKATVDAVIAKSEGREATKIVPHPPFDPTPVSSINGVVRHQKSVPSDIDQ